VEIILCAININIMAAVRRFPHLRFSLTVTMKSKAVQLRAMEAHGGEEV
jgi:hypothetical protein